MTDEIETVRKHCKHKDCGHRGRFNGTFKYGEACCDYILDEGEPRGCPISKCDKYVPRRWYNKKKSKW